MGTRAEVMKAIKSSIKSYANGKYTYVYRGPIDWSTFAWDLNAFASAIFCPKTRNSFEVEGATACLVQVDLFTRTPGLEDGYDDEVIDSLYDDMTGIFEQLRKLEDPRNPGDSLLVGMKFIGAEEAGFPGIQYKPQGLIVDFEITF